MNRRFFCSEADELRDEGRGALLPGVPLRYSNDRKGAENGTQVGARRRRGGSVTLQLADLTVFRPDGASVALSSFTGGPLLLVFLRHLA